MIMTHILYYIMAMISYAYPGVARRAHDPLTTHPGTTGFGRDISYTNILYQQYIPIHDILYAHMLYQHRSFEEELCEGVALSAPEVGRNECAAF